MRNKILKIGIIIILICSIVWLPIPTVYASLVNNAREESGDRPPPPVPPDEPSQPIDTPEPVVDDTIRIEIPYFSTIEGNVYEDMSFYGGTIPNQGIREILVQLCDSGGNTIGITRTDENGHYSFSPAPGTYTTKFLYGKLEGDTNAERTQQILKYNGHDYYVSELPGTQQYVVNNAITEEITITGRGCAQVFLLIDCSYGMRTTPVTINGITKSRLEVVVDSAKRLIDELLNSGENIYIGLEFFSGENYIACGLTKNKVALNQKLDEIVSNNWQVHNTDIYKALEKATDSFVNKDPENSNRYIVLLSDGIPTKAGDDCTIYRDDSDEYIRYMLRGPIHDRTKEKAQKIVQEDKVKLFALFVRADDPEENEIVADIFQPTANRFMSVNDGYEVVRAITNDIKEYIREERQEIEYTEEMIVTRGYEEAWRRQAVDSNFYDKVFTYMNRK